MSDDPLRQMFTGFVRLHILYHADKEPICGVEIMEELRHHGYKLGPGTLYPILHHLHEGGYLKRQETVVYGKRRKNFRITPRGKKLLDEANKEIKSISAKEAIAKQGDSNVVFVDLRDPRELQREGMVPDAFHAPRGMLEFWIDPESPYHKEIFASGKTFVFYCASGWRTSSPGATPCCTPWTWPSIRPCHDIARSWSRRCLASRWRRSTHSWSAWRRPA